MFRSLAKFMHFWTVKNERREISHHPQQEEKKERKRKKRNLNKESEKKEGKLTEQRATKRLSYALNKFRSISNGVPLKYAGVRMCVWVCGMSLFAVLIEKR